MACIHSIQLNHVSSSCIVAKQICMQLETIELSHVRGRKGKIGLACMYLDRLSIGSCAFSVFNFVSSEPPLDVCMPFGSVVKRTA